MPASYAHYRFGKEVLPTLPADVRQCIQRFRRMYDLGMNGPDFFFYYLPFLNTQTRELGKQFHRQSGRIFFEQACKAAASEAARAYLYGLLGHYCLDSMCHPYIQQLVQIGEAEHVPLESEFERFLLVLDKEPSPHTFDRSRRLKPTRGECMTIAEFFPGATGAKVSQSFAAMAFFMKLLANPQKERSVRFCTRFYPTLPDFRVPVEANEEMSLYTAELKNLYDQALESYPKLLAALTEYLQQGTPLGADFSPAFE